MADHVLKIHEQPFNDLLSGVKTCEVRNNDRGFQPGDTVQLHEIADTFTGRVMARKITHVQTGYGLPDGLCVLSYAQFHSQGGEAAAWMLADAVGGSMLEFQRDLLLEDQCRYGGEIVPLYTRPADQVAKPDAELVALLVECQRLLSAEPHGILSSMADQAKRVDWYSAMTPVRERIDALLAKSEGGKS